MLIQCIITWNWIVTQKRENKMRLVITNNLHLQFDEIVKLTADDMVEYAKGVVPVDSGELRDSIISNVNGTTAEVSGNTPYALIIEMGSSKRKPEPYLRPAMNRFYEFLVVRAKEVL